MKSIVQTSINYEIDERGEHLNMRGQAVGGNTEVGMGSGGYTQIAKPSSEVVAQLLETAKKKANIEKPITPEAAEIQADIALMQSVQL